MELAGAASSDDHAGEAAREQQDNPCAGLHEGEGTPTHVVVDLTAHQRRPGEERHPGTDPDEQPEHDGYREVPRQREADDRPSGEDDRQAEPAAPGERADRLRAADDTDAETEEEHREEQVERRVATTERRRVELGCPDHDAAGGERAKDAEHEAPHQRGTAHERPALEELLEHPWLALADRNGAAGDLLDADEHGQRRGEEGQGVEVERDVGRVVRLLAEERPQPRGHPGEQQRGGDRGQPVGRRERQLVRRLKPRPGQQIRHRGLFGRGPEHRDRLDHERRDGHPAEHDRRPAGQQRDGRHRRVEREPEQVADHHRVPAVEAIGQHAGERPEHHGRQQPNRDHRSERRALGCGAGDVLRREGEGCEQAEPVAER